MRKSCNTDQEKLLKFEETEGREFAKFLRSLQTKVRTIFGNRMLFQLVPGDFSYLISWKKLLGFRNIQEKLEKVGKLNSTTLP